MTPIRPSRRTVRLFGVATLVLGISLSGQPALAAPDNGAHPAGPFSAGPFAAVPSSTGPLAAAFATAAARHDVPRDLLVALGYSETRLVDHAGQPSASGGYGVMHLASNPKVRTLDEAAELTGLDPAVLRTDPAANITGAAAVLRSYADAVGLTAKQRAEIDQWYGPVVRYGGAADPSVARLYGDTVYDLLATGLVATPQGTGTPKRAVPPAGPAVPGDLATPGDTGAARDTVSVAGRAVAPQRGALARVPVFGTATVGAPDVGTLSTDYAPAAWAAASSSNYTVASRPSTYAINYVVIHVTQGSYAGSISWFQNPASQVSAHYTFRSSDGAVTQSVREKDVAWHAGNWTYNTQSIGIEHEGYVDNASWFTDAMYRASAALTRSVTSKYGIPRDRSHIIGHNQVPGATHTDPGPNWNWTYYMQLVTGSGSTVGYGTVGTGGGTLNIRSGPGTGYSVVGSVANGASVTIYCQTTGTNVAGYYGTTNIWNRIGSGQFISDAYVNTGHSGFIPGVPRC